MLNATATGHPKTGLAPTTVQQRLTILGDRQSGKTSLLIDMAVDEAAHNGGRVWFQTVTRREACHLVGETAERAEVVAPKSIRCTYRTNGRERIVFNNGGVIDFEGRYFWNKPIDLHVMDQVDNEPHPLARRVVRAVLR